MKTSFSREIILTISLRRSVGTVFFLLTDSTALALVLCTFAGNEAVAHTADCTRWTFSQELSTNTEVHRRVQEDAPVLYSGLGGGIDLRIVSSMAGTLEE